MSHLKVNKKGWDKIKKRLKRFQNRSIDVGFFRDKKYGPDNDNMFVAEVAFMNDQGSRINPPRPFLTVDFERYVLKEFSKDCKVVFLNLLLGQNTKYVKDMEAIGEKYQNVLKTIIYDYPGSNSPNWIAVKGFDDPLYHTGEMVESVDYRLRTPNQIRKRGS